MPLPLDEHLTAWRESQVDALVTFDPVLQVLRGEGAPVLFDSSAIPGEIVDVLVARTDALACCTQRISQLLAAHERALAHLGTAREDALRRMAPRRASPRQRWMQPSAVSSYQYAANRTLMSGTDSRLAALAQRMALTMLEQGLLQRRGTRPHLIDDRFVRGTTP